MATLKFLSSTVILTFSCLTGFTQTLKTIDSLEIQLQNCLDKGKYMLGCSKTFYYQMDSILNARYKQLRLMCDSVQKENLKDEQLEWLAKRDRQFNQNKQQVNKEAKKDGYEGGQDETMFLTEKNAMYVKQRVIELINGSPKNYSADKYKVNSTGSYSLDSKIEIKNGDTYGYFGDIKLKEISNNRIIVRLFVCKGAPSYNSGTLIDTLTITNNKAIYKTENDPSCKLVFTLYRRGIMVEQFANNPNFACGFGHGVDAFGFYKKKSSKAPTDTELAED
jgi:uncharacterized protein YecT (DUF1311 family)